MRSRLDPSRSPIQKMECEEFIDDRAVSVPSRIVAVAIVGIELLVLGADPLEERVARLGRTDIVLKPDVHDDRAGDLSAKLIPSKYATVASTSRRLPGWSR